MSTWHTCKTTHCRAGWVVMLAGKKGLELEKETNTLFAAMCIYGKSTNIKVHIPRYFDNNADAMKDIKECAEKEVKAEAQ